MEVDGDAIASVESIVSNSSEKRPFKSVEGDEMDESNKHQRFHAWIKENLFVLSTDLHFFDMRSLIEVTPSVDWE